MRKVKNRWSRLYWLLFIFRLKSLPSIYPILFLQVQEYITRRDEWSLWKLSMAISGFWSLGKLFELKHCCHSCLCSRDPAWPPCKSPALNSAWPQPRSLSMWKEARAGKERHVDPTRWKPAKQNHMGSSGSFPISPTAGMTYKRPSQVHSHCSSPRRDKGSGREKQVTPAGSLSFFLGQPLFTCGLQVAGAEPINTAEKPVGLAGGGHLSGGCETTVNHLPAKTDFLPNSLRQRATEM